MKKYIISNENRVTGNENIINRISLLVTRYFILLLTIFSLLSYNKVYAIGGTSLDPTSTLHSARQLGLGGLAIGFSDDASGVFANPSSLTRLKFPQMMGTSRKLLLEETQYTLLGWAMPTDWGTFGLGYSGMNTGGSLPTRLDPASGRIIIDPSREAIAYENAVFQLSYAREAIPDQLDLGGSLKFFNQSFSGGLSSRGQATGLDLSATYYAYPWLTLGANLQNVLEGEVKWDGGSSDKIGGFYKLGSKINILGATEEALYYHPQKLYAGFDVDIPHSTLTSSNYHLGLEYFPLEKVALRSGINMEENGASFTLGVGVVNGGFRFDYAYAARGGIPGDNPHYFTISYVGERVIKYDYKVKKKEAYAKFYSPKDRLITDKEKVAIKAEAFTKKIADQKKLWVVTGVSETFEVSEVSLLEPLSPAYLNRVLIEQKGTIETTAPLNLGKNVFEISAALPPEPKRGQITPEVSMTSTETKVLRIEPFTDTPMSHWAIEPIALSVNLGVVTGYPDNSFKPEKGITRAELVTLLVRTLPVKLAESVPYTGFNDVSTKHWAAVYIAYGSYKQLITGYPDGTFQPNKVLTRAEGITIMARYANLAAYVREKPSFPDLKPDYWANKYITPAFENRMLLYLQGKNFEPNAPFTRAEACEVLYRTPQIIKKVEDFWEKEPAHMPQLPIGRPAKAAPVKTAPETKAPTPEVQPKIVTPEAAPITWPTTPEVAPKSKSATPEAKIATPEATPNKTEPLTPEAAPETQPATPETKSSTPEAQ